ncbi:MAG TPA: hypothetical protein VFQ61_17240 [Polyangiaceae bacterium]|nr:hypothetical protein [Polyangiaceae bacterium]
MVVVVTRILARSVLKFRLAGAILPVFTAGAGCKEVTEAIVGKGVQAAKDATKGVSDGIEKGRKEGQSSDGALIVSKPEEVTGKGSIAVRALRARAGEPRRAEVELAFENLSERPMRFTGLNPIALDRENFVQRPLEPTHEVTVPPKAKERLTFLFEAEPSSLAKVRVWGVEYPLPAPTPPPPASASAHP